MVKSRTPKQPTRVPGADLPDPLPAPPAPPTHPPALEPNPEPPLPLSPTNLPDLSPDPFADLLLSAAFCITSPMSGDDIDFPASPTLDVPSTFATQILVPLSPFLNLPLFSLPQLLQL